MKPIKAVIVFLGAMMSAVTVGAQDYPNQAITLVIPFTPGGGPDMLGRYLADALSKEWKQPVVVENRPGAGGAIGMSHVAKAKPNGYTLGFTSSTLAVTAVGQGLPFDPIKDLQPVGMAAMGQMIVVSGKRIPLPTLADVAREAKKQTVFYGANGINSGLFAAEIFGQVANVDLEVVNYKGGAEAIIDLGAGRLDLFFAALPTVLPHIKSNTIIPVAVLGTERLKALPDVPTVAEAGFPGAEFGIWYGVFGPSDMPSDVLSKLNADINKVMTTPAGTDMLEQSGASLAAMSVQQFTKYYQDEVAKLRTIAKERNLIPQ